MEMFPSQGAIAERYERVVFANQLKAYRDLLAKSKEIIDGNLVLPSHRDANLYRKNLALALKIIGSSVDESRAARIGLKHNYRVSRGFAIFGVIVSTIACIFMAVLCMQSTLPMVYAGAVFVFLIEIASIALLVLSLSERQETAVLRMVEKRSEITDATIPWVLVQKLFDIIFARVCSEAKVTVQVVE